VEKGEKGGKGKGGKIKGGEGRRKYKKTNASRIHRRGRGEEKRGGEK